MVLKFNLHLMRLLYIVVFVAALFIFVFQANYLARFIYPFYYRDIIVSEAEKHGQDPMLIAALIYVESRFKSSAKSDKGAVGLMQIMPQTGRWVAEQIGMDGFSEEILFDPRVNIVIGTWYLNDLLRQFNNNIYLALAAYNGGRGHVSSWLEKGIWNGSRENVDDIPFPETRYFILKVERTYRRYVQIYRLN